MWNLQKKLYHNPKEPSQDDKAQGDVAHNIRVKSKINFSVMCRFFIVALCCCYTCLISARKNELKTLKSFKNHTPLSSINSANCQV